MFLTYSQDLLNQNLKKTVMINNANGHELANGRMRNLIKMIFY